MMNHCVEAIKTKLLRICLFAFIIFCTSCATPETDDGGIVIERVCRPAENANGGRLQRPVCRTAEVWARIDNEEASAGDDADKNSFFRRAGELGSQQEFRGSDSPSAGGI